MDLTVLQSRSAGLRLELKSWEKSFAASHDGRKASREEIKQDAAIAAKYKEYNTVRDLIANRCKPTAPPQTTTPTKPRSRRPLTTPSKTRGRLETQTETVESPAHLTTPAILRAFIGPTPQKDGVVLGLFDLLPSHSPDHSHSTPSKPPTSAAQRIILDALSSNAIPSTPSKTRYASLAGAVLSDDDDDDQPPRHSRTPQSTGKRFLLDSFVTPSKRRRLSESLTTPSKPTALDTPQGFSTPSFLRRDSQRLASVPEASEAAHDDGEAPASPTRWTAPMMRRRKGMARSLSSMIAEMRAQEEERLDEDMDLLREMEGGRPATSVRRKVQVQVEDSQCVDVGREEDEGRLGPDGVGSADEDGNGDAEGALGRDGAPVRVWKKKGLKRQTKRVLMRPIARAATRSTTTNDALSPSAEETTETVAETQLTAPAETDDELHCTDRDEDEEGSTYSSDAESINSNDAANPKSRPKQAKSNPFASAPVPLDTTASTTVIAAAPSAKGKDGVKEKIGNAVKKVASTAHANFRKLKIRSSKGAAGGSGGGFRGKFGRRR